MPQVLARPLKILATVVILGAIAIELDYAYANASHLPLWLGSGLVLWFCHLALVSHALEAAIALVWVARSPGLAPKGSYPLVRTGLYTFFVGTVGLGELYIQSKSLGD